MAVTIRGLTDLVATINDQQESSDNPIVSSFSASLSLESDGIKEWRILFEGDFLVTSEDGLTYPSERDVLDALQEALSDRAKALASVSWAVEFLRKDEWYSK